MHVTEVFNVLTTGALVFSALFINRQLPVHSAKVLVRM